jgi:hypothetical protein
MGDLSAHALLGCWVHHLIVGQNVLFTRTVPHILHVYATSAVTLAPDHVVSMRGALFIIINQCAHVILALKEIHFLAAILFKVRRLQYVARMSLAYISNLPYFIVKKISTYFPNEKRQRTLL